MSADNPSFPPPTDERLEPGQIVGLQGYSWTPPPKFQHRYWRHILLFVADARHDHARQAPTSFGGFMQSVGGTAPDSIFNWHLLLQRPVVLAAAAGDSGRARIRTLHRLPPPRRGRDAALLHPGAASADRHVRRGDPHPRGVSRRSARCSTSASPDRSPGSSRSCRFCTGASDSRRSCGCPNRRARSCSSASRCSSRPSPGCTSASFPAGLRRRCCIRWGSRPGGACWRRR